MNGKQTAAAKLSIPPVMHVDAGRERFEEQPTIPFSVAVKLSKVGRGAYLTVLGELGIKPIALPNGRLFLSFNDYSQAARKLSCIQ